VCAAFLVPLVVRLRPGVLRGFHAAGLPKDVDPSGQAPPLLPSRVSRVTASVPVLSPRAQS
jgi:hypothetical protein